MMLNVSLVLLWIQIIDDWMVDRISLGPIVSGSHLRFGC